MNSDRRSVIYKSYKHVHLGKFRQVRRLSIFSIHNESCLRILFPLKGFLKFKESNFFYGFDP